MDRVETELLRLMEARLRVTPELNSNLTELNLDSIKTADFLRELEYEFEVQFDQDVFELETVADLAAYIRRRLTETSGRE
ncbi:MAG: phosphopantetheine-binding protein [Gammaproteobacteria bacterium]|nr:phosphopantetheine-binding protein [Gammaproteobacteria bacterium]